MYKNTEKFSRKWAESVFSIGVCLSAFSATLAALLSIKYYGLMIGILTFITVLGIGTLLFFALGAIISIQSKTLSRLSSYEEPDKDDYDEMYDIRRYYS
ncbi:MAG: hypothetical protein IJX92_05705 [Clostridia bacterium]|nr:hypothetical protein [Clostridia bacterium]